MGNFDTGVDFWNFCANYISFLANYASLVTDGGVHSR